MFDCIGYTYIRNDVFKILEDDLCNNRVYDAIKKNTNKNICVALLEVAIIIFFWSKFPDVKGVTMLKYKICKTEKWKG